jgi:hypothetical protein
MKESFPFVSGAQISPQSTTTHTNLVSTDSPTMEVASPLTFGNAKRHYPGSPPGFVDPNRSCAMMDASASTSSGEPNFNNEYTHQPRAFKRRRFTTCEDNPMESDNTENSQNHAFPVHSMVVRGPFTAQGTLPFITMVFVSFSSCFFCGFV